MSKRRRGQGKGAEFERTIAKILSEWWSGGERSDLCWRTSQSGGRATTRGKKGETTAGHYGDITNTTPDMRAFFRLVTVEAKKGYNDNHGHQLIDRPKAMKGLQGVEKFILQAKKASEAAGTPYWLLIHRRDNRETVVYVPRPLYDALSAIRGGPVALYMVKIGAGRMWFACLPLRVFLKASPDDIRSVLRSLS